MAAPDGTTIVFKPGLDGSPSNDTESFLGDIDTGTVLTGLPNTIINSPPVSTIDQTFYGGVYIENDSTGSLTNARVNNRAGSIPNTNSAICQIASSSASDTSALKIRITGLASAVLTTDEITLNGTTPVMGTITYDGSGIYMSECLSSVNVPTTPVGNVTISVGGEIIGIIYGSAVKPSVACNMVTSLFTFAVADTKNVTIGAANRLTEPVDISAFYHAVKWPGNDSSVPIPDNILEAGDYVGIVIKQTIPGSLPLPVASYFRLLPYIVGNAVE